MCQGLVLLFDSTSYKQTHCTKLPGNQAASLLLNGTAVKKYVNLMPGVYRAIDLITTTGNNDEILIPDSFYKKIIDIINDHSKTDNLSFKRILDDVKQDLSFTKNKSKREVLIYANGTSIKWQRGDLVIEI